MSGGRILVVGDIHGHNKALQQVLWKSKFDFDKDLLISLGDICDRGPNTFGCVETLLKCKNLIAIKGNHDDEFIRGTKEDSFCQTLFSQGARETIESYIRNIDEEIENYNLKFHHLPKTHQDFFDNQRLYHEVHSNTQKFLFVHGGYNRHELIVNQKNHDHVLLWDRDLLMSAYAYELLKEKEYKFKNKDNFDLIFIGHTPTQYFSQDKPMKVANIWNLDTGCGKGDSHTLTIMDMETQEYWQSDPIGKLYK